MSAKNCPEIGELQQYLLGKLNWADGERVGYHLDACPKCQGRIMQSPPIQDSLIAGLRMAAPDDEFLNDGAYREAVGKIALLAQSSPYPRQRISESVGKRELALPFDLRDYRLYRKLASGGMGSVYHAVHRNLEKQVAVKLLPPSAEHDARLALRFQQEMKAVGKLDHPNIVRALDAGEFEGRQFLVMEFVTGIDLSDLTEQVKVRPSDAAEMVRQAALGLEHAHARGLVHRDVKPSNLMLTKTGRIKVLDLGLARFHDEQVSPLTGHNQILGTPDYMAPEQWEDSRSVDRAVDIYALGATLYCLLTGRAPFDTPETNSLGKKMLAHRSMAPAPPRSVRGADIPEGLDRLVLRLLAKEPKDRLPSCAAVASSLRPFCDDAALKSLGGMIVREPESLDLLQTPVEVPVTRNTSKQSELSADEPPDFREPQIAAWRRYWWAPVAAAVLVAGYSFMGRHPRSGDPETASAKASESAAVPSNEPTTQPTVLPDTALAAHRVLRKYCSRCHGIKFEVPDFDVLKRDSLLAVRGKNDRPYVTPGDPGRSLLWAHAGADGDMPPEDADQPTLEERLTLKTWIEAGAPFPSEERRALISEKQVLADMIRKLEATPTADRPFLRFFTLTNLHNQPGVDDAELRLHRAALSKLLNSLSWEPKIVRPEVVGSTATILAIDLRSVGWNDPHLWQAVAKSYPYGLRHDHAAEPKLAEMARRFEELSSCELAAVRADWFIATASRPPLYHELMKLPDNVAALERQLGVDAMSDFVGDRLIRAGFATSGISGQNRLIDRHSATNGAYWKSFDFKTNDGRGSIFHFPLGPAFAANEHGNFAFEYDGGEIIFNLPNGLQGYYLVDQHGQRIDAGPVEIVSDTLKTAGNVSIVNGLSCMACHKHGVVRVRDGLRTGSSVQGAARRKLEAICVPPERLDSLFNEDENRFLAALDQAVAPFLNSGSSSRPVRELPEPIGPVARRFAKDLSLDVVASELGVDDVPHFRKSIESRHELRKLGLSVLLDGGAVKRDAWQSLERVVSTFQKAALELNLGTPHRVLE